MLFQEFLSKSHAIISLKKFLVRVLSELRSLNLSLKPHNTLLLKLWKVERFPEVLLAFEVLWLIRKALVGLALASN